MAVLVTLVSGIPGPLVGLALILLNAVSLEVAGYISSLIFAMVYPITIIATTLYYLQRKKQHAELAAEGRANNPPFWARLRHSRQSEPPAAPAPAQP